MNKRTFVFYVPVLFLVILLLFILSFSRLQQGNLEQGRLQLEQAVQRSAVACYAAEGFYPPNVAYMQEHYGLQWNSQRYIIHYEIFASNLMPDITVLCK